MAAYLAPAQNPHQIGAMDDAQTRQVSLAEKAARFRQRLLRIDGEAKCCREDVPPLVELVVELGDDGREARCVEGGARVSSVEELVDAVEKASHAYAG
jgi:hypothetical protein